MAVFLIGSGVLAAAVGVVASVNWLRGRVSLESISVGEHVQLRSSQQYVGQVLELQPKKRRMLVRSRAGYEFFIDFGRVERWRA